MQASCFFSGVMQSRARIFNSFQASFLAWTPTRLGLRLMKIACDILNAGIPIEPPFLRGKLAGASQLPKVIDGGLEYGSQFFHREEMSRRLLTGLEITVQTQLNCLTHQIDDCLILTSLSLLKRLDRALPPIMQNECWWIAILQEHDVEQEPSHSAIAIEKGVQTLKVVVGDCRTCRRVITQCLVAVQPARPLCQIQRQVFCRRGSKAGAANMNGPGTQLPRILIDLRLHQAMQKQHRLQVDGRVGQAFKRIIGLGVVGHLQVFTQGMSANG